MRISTRSFLARARDRTSIPRRPPAAHHEEHAGPLAQDQPAAGSGAGSGAAPVSARAGFSRWPQEKLVKQRWRCSVPKESFSWRRAIPARHQLTCCPCATHRQQDCPSERCCGSVRVFAAIVHRCHPDVVTRPRAGPLPCLLRPPASARDQSCFFGHQTNLSLAEELPQGSRASRWAEEPRILRPDWRRQILGRRLCAVTP